MRGAAALGYRRATSEDVIAYLRADNRIRAGVDPEADLEPDLSQSTTIAEWRAVCDLIPPRRLAGVMNDWFGTDLPVAEWRAVLSPQHTRTLGDLAAYVAQHAQWPAMRPVRVAGVEDPAVSAYFSLRALMVMRGARIEGLSPSAPLRESDLAHLADAMALLAPSLVPVPPIESTPRTRFAGGIALVALALGALGTIGGSFMWITLGMVLLLAALHANARSGPVLLGSTTTIGAAAREISALRTHGPGQNPRTA